MTTGVFAGFGFAVRQFGPAVVWSWIFVTAGNLLVALVLAELSAHYPLSGYGYQWTSRLINPHVGFFIGWSLLIQLMTGFPAACSAIGQYTEALVGPGVSPKWFTLALVTVAALIHIFGIRLAAFLNDTGVVMEIAGSVAVALVLLVMFGPHHLAPFRLFLDSTAYPSGLPGGVKGFIGSLLMGAWCLTGFEAAANLAEETHRPATVVPKAIMWSLIASSIGGLLILCGFFFAMPNLRAVQASSTPLSDILLARLGPGITRMVMLLVFVAIFACAVASLATETRLLFSMARDNMLPGSSWLKKVHPTRRIPTNCIVLAWVISCIVILRSRRRIEIITCISAVATYIGYAGIIVAGMRGMSSLPKGDGFNLGRWRYLVGPISLAWVAVPIATLASPLANPSLGRLPSQVLVGALIVGVVFYCFLIRTRIRRGQAGPP